MRKQKIVISVIGGHEITEEAKQLAYDVGRIVAQSGAVLACGGLFGAMEAACKGAKEAGGMTIGILPGKEKKDANDYVDVALPTSIGYSRNVIVACSADIVVALPGSYGTNSEICYALVYNRPVIDLGDWKIKGMIPARDAAEAGGIIRDYIHKLT